MESHPSLFSRPTKRMGINPFTRKPQEFKTRGGAARIHANGVGIGAIDWAQDGSPFLIVDAEEGTTEAVIKIALEIATRLNARFIQDPMDGTET